MLQDVVHGHHVRVTAQPRGVPGLGTGPGDPGRAVAVLARAAEHDLLERDLAGQPLVVGEPDMSHAAAAQLVQQKVPAGDDPADSRLR